MSLFLDDNQTHTQYESVGTLLGATDTALSCAINSGISSKLMPL